MAVKAQAPPEPRELMGDVAQEVFSREWFLETAEGIKNMTTGVWGEGNCPDCGSARKLLVKTPDIKGQLAAATEWMEQVWGRPGTDSVEQQGTTIVVERPPRG